MNDATETHQPWCRRSIQGLHFPGSCTCEAPARRLSLALGISLPDADWLTKRYTEEVAHAIATMALATNRSVARVAAVVDRLCNDEPEEVTS